MEEKKRLCQWSMEIACATREKNCQMYKNLKPLPSGTKSKSSPELRRHHSKLPKKSVTSDTMRSIDHFELQMEKRLSVMMSGNWDVKCLHLLLIHLVAMKWRLVEMIVVT